MQDSSK
jgi:DNA mismatch repair protein MSH6